MNKPIVIVGGHLSVALAVIEALAKQNITNIHFFGRMQTFKEYEGESFEYHTISKRNIPFVAVSAPRLIKGATHSPVALFSWAFRLIPCIIAIRRELVKIRPSVLVSFGGYLGGAVVLAAWTAGIPIVIHEQTRSVGFANRMSAFFAQEVYIAWEQSRVLFHPRNRHKIMLTGNPVRHELLTIKPKKHADKLLTLYITGGSTGAHAVNEIIGSMLSKLLANFRIIHQCGESQFHDFEELIGISNKLPKPLQARYTLTKFIASDAIASVFHDADIIIGRSGANTVVELAVTGKPAILIPLPHAAGDEQMQNAAVLQQARCAIILRQEGLTENTLHQAISVVARRFEDFQTHALSFSQTAEIKRHREASFAVASCIARYVSYS